MQLLATILILIAVDRAIGDEPADQTTNQEVRVAAISFVPTKFDLKGNANRLEQAFRQAAKGGAKIAVAPEGVLEGYVVNEIISGQAAAEKMSDVAITIDGPMIKRFQKLAAELKMCLVFGFAERIKDDVFNCACFIDDNGNICGKYHKMQLAEGYDPAWWFNRLGRQSRAFDTPYGRCGVLICNDRWNPQLAKIPALDGAQFLVIPSFGSRSLSQDKAVLDRGIESGLPVIEANVGVTFIVNKNRIVVVNRQEKGITFGTITIPSSGKSQPKQRDLVEQDFLKWREHEMKRRLARTLRRLQSKK